MLGVLGCLVAVLEVVGCWVEVLEAVVYLLKQRIMSSSDAYGLSLSTNIKFENN